MSTQRSSLYLQKEWRGKHACLPIHSLTSDTCAAIIDFCQGVCGMPPGHYEKRLLPGIYDAILLSYDAESELNGMQLVNDFEKGGRRYLYFGPLISRKNGFALMIRNFLENLRVESGGYFAFMAEAQNPYIAILLLYCLEGFAEPSLSMSSGLEQGTRDALVSVFAEALSHIEHIDGKALVSRGSSTMYRSIPYYMEIMEWFRLRGVDFAAGDAQIILAKFSEDPSIYRQQISQVLKRSSLLLNSSSAQEVREVLFHWFASHLKKDK